MTGNNRKIHGLHPHLLWGVPIMHPRAKREHGLLMLGVPPVHHANLVSLVVQELVAPQHTAGAARPPRSAAVGPCSAGGPAWVWTVAVLWALFMNAGAGGSAVQPVAVLASRETTSRFTRRTGVVGHLVSVHRRAGGRGGGALTRSERWGWRHEDAGRGGLLLLWLGWW